MNIDLDMNLSLF